MLGASAAIFTLAACVMLVSPLKFSWLFLAPQGLVAIIYFVYNVAVVAAKSRIPGYDPHVAYVAHIIGFVIGIPFGIAFSDRWKRNFLITLRSLRDLSGHPKRRMENSFSLARLVIPEAADQKRSKLRPEDVVGERVVGNFEREKISNNRMYV